MGTPEGVKSVMVAVGSFEKVTDPGVFSGNGSGSGKVSGSDSGFRPSTVTNPRACTGPVCRPGIAEGP